MLAHTRSILRLIVGSTPLVALGPACDGAIGPSVAIEGIWDIVGYVDQDVAAAAAGRAEFRTDGHFTMSGTLTFPGEPVDTLSVAGTYQQLGARVTLTTPDGSGVWRMTALGSTLTLTLSGVTPPTRITLSRSGV